MTINPQCPRRKRWPRHRNTLWPSALALLVVVIGAGLALASVPAEKTGVAADPMAGPGGIRRLTNDSWLVPIGDLDGDGVVETLVVVRVPEDLDGDGAWDVSEDLPNPVKNGILDEGEDYDGDGRLTPPDGCEGVTREDQDCDGHLDQIDEDFNGNGILDPGEDLDGDRRLDRGTEDRNHNRMLDDRPFPGPSDEIFLYEAESPYNVLHRLPPHYPYTTFVPRVTFRAFDARVDRAW